MLLHQKDRDPIGSLTEQVRSADHPSPELLSRIIVETCTRLPNLKKEDAAHRIDRLIHAGAWCDAALALVRCELPSWTPRRLVYDDGEWFCSLSREPNLPAELDDTADAHHEVMALAILAAFLEARRMTGSVRKPQLTLVPKVQPASGIAVCCDDFS